MVSEINTETENDQAESFLLGIAMPVSRNRKTVDNSDSGNLSDDEMALMGCASGNPRKETTRVYRFYNLIARPISGDDPVIEEHDLISTTAGRLRSKYRKLGYRVDLIETNTVHMNSASHRPFPNLPPAPDLDSLGGKGIPNPVPYDSPRIHSRNSGRGDRIRALMSHNHNQSLARKAEKRQNARCFIYRKSDNAMTFAGTASELETYLILLKSEGKLDLNEIVVYVPDSVMRKSR